MARAVRQRSAKPSSPVQTGYRLPDMPAWRNWQTRWTQNPVPARACRFDPGRRYIRKDKRFKALSFFCLDY